MKSIDDSVASVQVIAKVLVVWVISFMCLFFSLNAWEEIFCRVFVISCLQWHFFWILLDPKQKTKVSALTPVLSASERTKLISKAVIAIFIYLQQMPTFGLFYSPAVRKGWDYLSFFLSCLISLSASPTVTITIRLRSWWRVARLCIGSRWSPAGSVFSSIWWPSLPPWSARSALRPKRHATSFESDGSDSWGRSSRWAKGPPQPPFML